MNKLEEIQNVCLKRGIIFPTAEIYPTISGFFDYGFIGTLLKRKLIDYWREFFIKPLDMIEIDGSIILPERVFMASGHVKNFTDPVTQCKKCKSIFRADHLIEDGIKKFVEGKTAKELTEIIKKNKIRCPKCKGELSDVKLYNLMIKTEISPMGRQVGYLRPETAQNIFTDFQRIYRTSRAKLPFGIATVGRSFRNEISPRQFIIRLREFNQCEIEMFFDPENPRCDIKKINDKSIILLTRDAQKRKEGAKKMKIGDLLKKETIPNPWLAYFLVKEFEFYKSLGIPEHALRFRHMLPEETPHYSAGNFDLEIKFDFGWKEVVGNAYRSDHDLKNHMKNSGCDLSVMTDAGKKIIPHVVEPSFGIERTVAGILLYTFRREKERGWNWFKFPSKIAPYIAGIYPLINKEKLPETAKEIYKTLKNDFDVFYDDRGSIGKRYARADEIGTLFGITIDGQTLKDNTVTIRNRDTTKQTRVSIKDIRNVLKNNGI
ncbi:MAG: glycine--tRNA ligase [Candidatus Aenigmarchaeota archaeon]|nr:glycine--tRNA ligase [Candidatus Aenigmarchaeota archaeon]